MNVADDELKTAKKLYQQKKFSELIKLLASHVFIYRQVAEYFKLIGLASLQLNDFAGAHSYLLRANDLKPECFEVQTGLACTFLQRRDETNAVSILLKLQEQKRHKAFAENFLNFIRNHSGADWSKLAQSDQLADFFPHISFNLMRFLVQHHLAVWSGISAVAVLVTVLSIVNLEQQASDRFRDITLKQNLDPALLKESEAKLLSTDELFSKLKYAIPITQLNQTEQNKLFADTSNYFNQYRDNLARQSANKILLANANDVLVQKLKQLTIYFREPNFVNFRDNVDYKDLVKAPWYFAGCYVRWTGKVSNLLVKEDQISFTLLKGYEKGRLVEAEVDVKLYFPIQLYNDAAIELIGQVNLDRITKGLFFLKAISIRQIRPSVL